MTNEERLVNTVLELQAKHEIINWHCELDPTQPLLDFGVRKSPTHYIEAELKWYNSMSLSIDGIKEYASMWEKICATDGTINSNYGWCIFSAENGNQYENVVAKLRLDPASRQGSMIYTRPTMHRDAKRDGMKDFMCTMYTQSFIRDGMLIYNVHQRSCDFIYGFFNDFAWHCHVYARLREDLKVKYGMINYVADTIHVYPRHYDLLSKFDIKLLT